MSALFSALLAIEYLFLALSFYAIWAMATRSDESEFAAFDLMFGTMISAMIAVIFILLQYLGYCHYPLWWHYPLIIPVIRIVILLVINR